jgi:hypothetical protein
MALLPIWDGILYCSKCYTFETYIYFHLLTISRVPSEWASMNATFLWVVVYSAQYTQIASEPQYKIRYRPWDAPAATGPLILPGSRTRRRLGTDDLVSWRVLSRHRPRRTRHVFQNKISYNTICSRTEVYASNESQISQHLKKKISHQKLVNISNVLSKSPTPKSQE